MREEVMTSLCSQLGQLCQKHEKWIVTAESCTGGWIAQVITSIPGSSTWFERGFVTYTNVAKQEMLAVSGYCLETFGAVSAQTVAAMASGALLQSHAHYSVSVSGIAGPDGGSDMKPVGLVYFAFAARHVEPEVKRTVFSGVRDEVRQQAVEFALTHLTDFIERDLKLSCQCS